MFSNIVQGLVQSLEQVCPQSEHRTCVRHLYANFRSEGHRGVLLKDLLWQALAAYTKQEFYIVMDEIKRTSKDAHAYLEKVDPNTWCRGWFNTNVKSGLLHNNTCESFNSWIKKFHDQTILSMLEGIRYKLMRTYVRKKEMINSMEEAIGPKIRKKLEKEEDEASSCCCTYAGQGMFEVECLGRRFVVDVDARTCGCRKWDVTGIPCSHAISAILHQDGDPNDYLSPYYSKEMDLKCYDYIIYPVPSEEQWPRSGQPNIEPPKSRVTPGRPKKLRNIGVEEPRNPSAIRKGGNKNQCGHCRKFGHNKRSCEAKLRHDERRDRARQFYRENASIDWSLDMFAVFTIC
ncbi:uncharacterized protein LOC132192169 [Corylus avellana]|uniref:uncharacterized protein LOC132192169 n=1 Tax=Corylus avellana TaxID=13451 RepID=UPI00286D1A4B|nr:uncharacterized protein LOC132192169 [Corylus avellana]